MRRLVGVEVDALKRCWRRFGAFSLTEGQVVRGVAIDDYVGAKRDGQRVVSSDPLDFGAVDQLYRSVSYRTSDGLRS